MSQNQALNVDFQQQLDWARQLTLSERFYAGEELFHEACRVTLAGIRHQQPDLDEQAAWAVLDERLRWAESRENKARHQPTDDGNAIGRD
jgi:hypothetical protein